ncbi:MAG: MscL family protein, partial [Pirellulaceae bacterium]
VQARALGPVLAWGNFVTIVINFLIMAGAVFLLVKAMNTAQKRFEKQQLQSPPEPPADVKLLSEIRDLLKARQGIEAPAEVSAPAVSRVQKAFQDLRPSP